MTIHLQQYAPVKNGYPYSVELSLQYNLFDDRIEICYSVFNPGFHSIPFCIGAHPAIACDDLDNCTLVFEKREKASTPVMDLDTRLFRSKERIQRLDGSSKLPLGLWTPAGKRAGFICIEPWCGSDDYDDDSGIFKEKKGIQILEGKKFARYKMVISAQ